MNPTEELLGTLSDWTQALLDDAHELSSAQRNTLAEALAHATPQVRDAAATLLGAADHKTHHTFLSRWLEQLKDEPVAFVRQALAAGLGDALVGLDQERDAVIEKLARRIEEENDGAVQFEIAFALAQARDLRALPWLEAALEHTRFRLPALEALARLHAPDAAPSVQALLKKWFLPWPDRVTAEATLHVLGEQSGTEGLLRELRHRNRAVRRLALGLVVHHEVREAITTLVERAPKERHPEEIISALRSLGANDALQVLSQHGTLRPHIDALQETHS